MTKKTAVTKRTIKELEIFRFISTLQLSFFYLLLLIIFYFIFFIYTFFFTHDIYPTTHDQRHLATLSGNIEL